MQVKLFEIRDRLTFIPAMAILIQHRNDIERKLLHHVGCAPTERYFALIRLVDFECHLDSHDWSNRTMRTAHEHIAKEWDYLEGGSVIDVEFILGESDAPKESELPC